MAITTHLIIHISINGFSSILTDNQLLNNKFQSIDIIFITRIISFINE